MEMEKEIEAKRDRGQERLRQKEMNGERREREVEGEGNKRMRSVSILKFLSQLIDNCKIVVPLPECVC